MEINKEWVLSLLLLMILLCFDVSRAAVGNEFHRDLKPVKTVQIGEEEFFDCIDINKQPSLNHPRLKGHKIQMKPTSLPAFSFEEKSTGSSSEAPIVTMGCPTGTVPIHRSKNTEDMKADYQFPGFDARAFGNLQYKINQSQYYVARKTVEGEYNGAKASLSVHAPEGLHPLHETGAVIALTDLHTPPAFSDQIFAGWFISQQLYHDTRPRFTALRSSAEDGSYCVNIMCSGFIQIDRDIALGAPFTYVSQPGGTQYFITLLLYFDPVTQNWWLLYGGRGQYIGYWPNKLFTFLSNHASVMLAMGYGTSIQGDTGPPIGSGEYPIEGYRYAAYIKDIQVSVQNNIVKATPWFKLEKDTEQCYFIGNLNDDSKWGLSFFYGGPGGCTCKFDC